MKRFFTCLLAAVCLCGIVVAGVYVSPSPLEQGFTGKLTLTFWPDGGDPMVTSDDCYAHMGLLTSESLHDSDVKYWAPGTEAYATTEPKWKKQYYDSDSWDFVIDNIYEYFGCPEGTDITGISIWFHDGKGVGNAKESHDIKGRPWIVPIHKEETCYYTILRKGESDPTWNEGVLMIWDKGYRTFVTYDYSGSARKVAAHGGQPYLSWFKGFADDDVSYDVISAGGKVIYTEGAPTEESGVKLTDDVCGDEAGDYTITNLKVKNEGLNNYTFTWDANPKFEKYMIDLYNDEGWVDGGYPYEPTWSVNLSSMTHEGSYRVVVSGLDENDNPFASSAEDIFVFELENVGETTVRLQIPTDCTWDPANGVKLDWISPDNAEHVVAMTNEPGTHWWTATIDVTAPKYRLIFITETSETERNWADNSLKWFNTNEVCREVNLRYSTAIDEGITYNDYDTRDIACDAEDHDYRISGLTTKVEDGTLFLEWKPSKNTADQYYITFYTGSYDYLASTTAYEDTKTEWTLGESYKEVEITMIEIQPMLNSEFSPFEIVDPFISTDPVKVVNPYMPTNIQEQSNGLPNVYDISWDAYENVKWYVVNVVDDNSDYLFSKTLEVGKDIIVKDGRCSITTEGLTRIGTVYVTILAKDKDAYDRAYATYTFDVTSLENIGETTFGVLITPDCCFDVSNGVWFCWHSDNDLNTWVKATKSEGTNWYSASFSVNDVQYELSIGNRDEANWSDATIVSVYNTLTAASEHQYFCMQQDVYTQVLEVKRLADNADMGQYDHNYTPQGIHVTVHEETGLIEVAINVETVAPWYAIDLFDGVDNVKNYWSLSSKKGVLKDGVLTYTLNPKATTKVTIEKVRVMALDENEATISTCAERTENQTFDLPLNPLFPRGLKAVENEDHSLTLTWDANDDVEYYAVQVRYVPSNSWVDEWRVQPDQIVPKDGKLSVTTSNMWCGNGKYVFYVTAYDLNDEWCGNAETYVTASKEEDLGEVTIRVLIPSDNNFDVSGGVWLCYWFYGEEYDADGRFVAMTESPADSHWYEAKFDAGAENIYNFCIANGDNWAANPDRTSLYEYYTSKELCFEFGYCINSWDTYWTLNRAECDASDHNYAMTLVDPDNSKPGRITFNVNTSQIAPYYVLYVRENGSGDSYAYECTYSLEEDKTFTAPFNNETDITYDYILMPVDKYYAWCRPYEGVFVVKANSNIPTDLKATLADDNQTVTFEWKKNGTETASFGIEASDYMDIDVRDVKDITEEQYTATFCIHSSYNWYLTAYDAEGQPLSRVQGPSVVVKAPDLTPTNLNVAVQGKAVTLAWQTPLAAPQCLYIVRDSHTDDTLAIGHITGKDGFYRASFTIDEDRVVSCNWSVIAEAANDEFISNWAYGTNFMVEGSTQDPAPGTRHTLTISAAAGGYVNESVNGEWAENAKVVIRATAISGWDFEKWSDGDMNATRKITMDKDYNLKALFTTPFSFSFEVKADEHGSVNSSVNGIYNGGSVVLIEATPDEGYVFDHWSDGSKEAAREYLITEDVVLTAYFAKQGKVTLIVKISPDSEYGSVLFDGVEVSGNKKSVNVGETVTLKAEANSGYQFVRFEKNGTELSDDTEYTVTVTEDVTITAVFKEKSQGVQNTEFSEQTEKLLINGELYILREGKVYSVQGQRVK